MEKCKIYNREYTLTTNSTNNKDELLMTSAIDIFQDIAGKHALLISESPESLKEKGYFLVITRSRVEICENYIIGTSAKVKTYQSNIGAASYEREYFLNDEFGNIKVKGDSRWCVLDINTGRIVPSSQVENTNEVCEEKAFDKPYIKIPPLKDYDGMFTYKVSYCDIDHNNHTNNTKYITPIINYFMKNIKYMEINYLKQTYLNDELKYYLKKITNNEYFVYIYKNDELINKCFIEMFE